MNDYPDLQPVTPEDLEQLHLAMCATPDDHPDKPAIDRFLNSKPHP